MVKSMRKGKNYGSAKNYQYNLAIEQGLEILELTKWEIKQIKESSNKIIKRFDNWNGIKRCIKKR